MGMWSSCGYENRRGWGTMETHCPHLGLRHNKHQALLLPSPHHRCYVGGEPERIPTAFQAETCLTAAYRRCPRLESAARPSAPALFSPPRSEGPPEPEAPAPTVAQSPQAGPRLHRVELEPIPPEKPRRPLTLTELAVLGLSGAIVLALVFLGYALAYRLTTGPGMEAPTLVAGGPAVTLVPTFTPTATPTPTVPATVGPTAAPPAPTAVPLPSAGPPSLPTRPPPASSPPTRLVIPALGLDIPVVPVGVKRIREDGRTRLVWDDAPNAGGFHQTSAYPGQPGNTVINGHRDIGGAVFRHLDRLQPGDEIILYVGDVPYFYQVAEKLIVPETFATAEQRAENLRLIGYIPEERLTLVTCTPVALATHRLLIIARPPAPGMPQAGAGP
ncbi:MAG TPA: sortase [Anaerolineae bacterium]|nr:sortase [Anaerolineae bacterium]